MKVIVSFSGGKDSLASLLWVRNNLTKDFITVFCDTGWEHPLTYKYIEEVQEQLGLNLITVKSKKFNGMVDLTKKKSRWPSSQRRFCTSELKTIPMIDYILDEVNDDVLIYKEYVLPRVPSVPKCPSNVRTSSIMCSHTVRIRMVRTSTTPIVVKMYWHFERNMLMTYCVRYSIGRHNK